jgi:hypothetical protein
VITRGKQSNLFTIVGYDATMLLEDYMNLIILSHRRRRLLAEGRVGTVR